MELRGNHITVAELLADPRSRAVFQRRFGRFFFQAEDGIRETEL